MDKDHCADCGKIIGFANRRTGGGGNLDYKGKWTQWSICEHCRPAVTLEDIKQLMTLSFPIN